MRPSIHILRLAIIHIIAWTLLYLLPPLVTQTRVKLPADFGEVMNWLFAIIFFYSNYIWLVPNFLSKKKFILYFLGVSLMIIVCYFAIEQFYQHQFRVQLSNYYADNNHFEPPPRNPSRYKGYNSSLLCFAMIALGTSIRVTQNWYENERQKKEMENQKLTAELSLLKSQINPHFFFNTLNSIYSLSIVKSKKTSEAVVKLSELMRYIIYDTERKVIPLSKELEYIGNYIELQRLRLPERIIVEYKTDLDEGESIIEPLLLLPFVENAFKHGIDVERGGKIIIQISRAGKELKLHVENPLFDNNGNLNNGHSGIGVNNTLKRLKLLYQDNFFFTAEAVKGKYIVTLTLKLKDDEVSDS